MEMILMGNSLINFNVLWFYFINQGLQNQGLQNSIFDFIMPIISNIGVFGWIIVAILMLLLGDEKAKKLGIWAIITMVIIQIVLSIIKVTVGESLPFEILPYVRVLDPNGGYSFPFGHSTLLFALGILLGANYKIKTKLFKDKNDNPREFSAIYPLLIFSAIVAFSGPYIGVYYPFDVISESLISVIIGLIMLKLYRRTNKIKTNNADNNKNKNDKDKNDDDGNNDNSKNDNNNSKVN